MSYTPNLPSKPDATCPDCGSKNLVVHKRIVDEGIYRKVQTSVECDDCNFVKIIPNKPS